MLKVLRDEKADPADRQWAAHVAAPYVHPWPAPEQRRITTALPDNRYRMEWDRRFLLSSLPLAAARLLRQTRAT
jgi:hypothetical protein